MWTKSDNTSEQAKHNSFKAPARNQRYKEQCRVSVSEMSPVIQSAWGKVSGLPENCRTKQPKFTHPARHYPIKSRQVNTVVGGARGAQ